MKNKPDEPMSTGSAQIEQALTGLPSPVLMEYRQSRRILRKILDADELSLWANEGVTIASQSARSWEAGVEYFKTSPKVAEVLHFPSVVQWARCGTYLCKDSPTLAAAYFRASPSVVPSLRPQYIPRWAGLGRGLYKGTWKSGILAGKFFEVSPEVIGKLPFWDVEMFASLIETLSRRSYDVAGECLVLGRDVLCGMDKERESFLSMCRALVDGSWREVKSCLEIADRVLPVIEDGQRSRFLRLAEQLAKSGHKETSTFLLDGAQSLTLVNPSSQRDVLDLAELLSTISSEAVPSFLKSLQAVLSRVTFTQMESWFEGGVNLLKENNEGGLAYFKIESNTSERILETLSSSMELERVKGVMRLYCSALCGTPVEILSSKELVRKGIGWVSESSASTEGTKVFLPPVVDQYLNKEENFGWFKVVATHQVAHLEFGSFQFTFDTPSGLFQDMRPALESDVLEKAVERLRGQLATEPDVSANGHQITDSSKFFHLFENRKLALDVFTTLEDSRLDYRVKKEYPGITFHYERVQAGALKERPPIPEFPLRRAMVELLIRLSLGQHRGLPVNESYADVARVLAKILLRLLTPEATVEDTSEATIRTYKTLALLPNEEQSPEDFALYDFDDLGEYSEAEFQELLDKLEAKLHERDQEKEELEEEKYESPQDIDYRGDFKPEMVQLLETLRGDQFKEGLGEPQEVTQEMLEQTISETAEIDLEGPFAKLQSAAGIFAQNIMRESGMPIPSGPPGQGYGGTVHEDETGGSLEASEPSSHVYDEWDFRAGDYKPKWCIVRERVVEEGDVRFFNDTLRSYDSLSSEIRRQFEMAVPEKFRKERRVIDGEEIDLDAAIEATVDRRAGITPSEKIWWRRNKLERDVAVVFLLDMSASTAEAIDEGRHVFDEQDAPDDPVEYMVWLRARREGMVRRHYKRIIDLEKESTALLIQALETIGDTYGIYGFSGYGRENVEFYNIKDIAEAFHDGVKRRIDKITPMHATRMGPAIRHATAKLEAQEAKNKMLFLISDGRPQDRGYSREGVEKEYAVHDTHMALMEAKHKAVTPFCLTVDKSGHDYLKAMCGDVSYEVLDNIWALPRRLPTLYRMLTT